MGVLAQQTGFRALFSSKVKAQRLEKGILKCVAGAQAGGVKRPAWGRGVLVLSVGGAFRAQGWRLLKEVAAGAWWRPGGRAVAAQLRNRLVDVPRDHLSVLDPQVLETALRG